MTSASVSAEISVRSPRKTILCLLSKTYFLNQSIKKLNLILKTEALTMASMQKYFSHCQSIPKGIYSTFEPKTLRTILPRLCAVHWPFSTYRFVRFAAHYEYSGAGPNPISYLSRTRANILQSIGNESLWTRLSELSRPQHHPKYSRAGAWRAPRCQCFFFSRNIGQLTPKNIYF